MAGRTASSSRNSRGSTSASRSRSTIIGGTKRVPDRRRQPARARQPVRSSPRRAVPLGPIGRTLVGSFNLLARGLGSMVRAAGRTRELDPAHRRDGVALLLIALGVAIAAGVWWRAGGPVGGLLDAALRTAVGTAAGLLPPALALVAVVLLRTEARPDARIRMVVGSLLFGFG